MRSTSRAPGKRTRRFPSFYAQAPLAARFQARRVQLMSMRTVVELFSDALRAPRLSPPPYPPFARGGKSAASGPFSPLAKGGHRGVLRVPLRYARVGIQAMENRSSEPCHERIASRLAERRPVHGARQYREDRR